MKTPHNFYSEVTDCVWMSECDFTFTPVWSGLRIGVPYMLLARVTPQWASVKPSFTQKSDNSIETVKAPYESIIAAEVETGIRQK
jgi:hypothetical protein